MSKQYIFAFYKIFKERLLKNTVFYSNKFFWLLKMLHVLQNRSEQDLQDKVSNLNLKIKSLENLLEEKDQCISARNEKQSVLEQKGN